MSTFQRAPKIVSEMVRAVLAECYPELYELTREKGPCALTFDLLFVHADLDSNGEPVGSPLKHNGRPAAAIIKAVPKADRALGRADVEIRFDGDAWKDTPEPVQLALIDHELYHLTLIRKDGLPSRDDQSRYRFKMREHDYDFGWFVEVAKRRGLNSGEVIQANRMVAKHGQILFGFAEMPAPQLPGMAGKTVPFTVVGSADAGGLAATGRWMLWEQMDAKQHKAAVKLWGDDLDRTHEFFVNDQDGKASNHRVIGSAVTANDEPEDPENAAPAPKRGRARAASKH